MTKVGKQLERAMTGALSLTVKFAMMVEIDVQAGPRPGSSITGREGPNGGKHLLE